MRTLDLENQFIELRAKGHSLRDIAEQLNVSKSTLNRWEPELAFHIHRLRRLLWEDAEAELGRSLEQDMKQLAARIRRWEDRLDQYDIKYCTLPNTLKVIRECRREYNHRRAILMTDRPPRTAPSPARSACEPSEPRDKTGHISHSTEPHPLKTNGSDQPQSEPSHSVTPELRAEPRCKTESNSRGHFSSQPSINPAPPSADAAQDSQPASHPPDPNPQPSTLSARPEGPQPDDSFLGSIVINPLECGAAIVMKCLEAEAIHHQRTSQNPGCS